MKAGACLVAVCMIAAWLAPEVRADGDPASDILTTQSLFLPQDAGVPGTQQAQLVALLQAAQRAGYPIRVALVASRTDLGSITELWRQPQRYAQFLGQELGLVYRGPLLVIMPGGFGVYQTNRRTTRERAALDTLTAPRTAAGLGAAALAAVTRLAADAGHPLPRPAAFAGSRAGNSADAVAWLLFALGGVLIVLAWGASLRVSRTRGAPSNSRVPEPDA
jgi:hypothetical protein